MNIAQTTGAPLRFWTGALVFLLPLRSLVTLSGAGLVSSLFPGSGLILFKPSRDAFVRHWPQVRRVVLAFLLHLWASA
jgi:O-antigen ligase